MDVLLHVETVHDKVVEKDYWLFFVNRVLLDH